MIAEALRRSAIAHQGLRRPMLIHSLATMAMRPRNHTVRSLAGAPLRFHGGGWVGSVHLNGFVQNPIRRRGIRVAAKSSDEYNDGFSQLNERWPHHCPRIRKDNRRAPRYRPDRYQQNIAHELAATVPPSNHAANSNTRKQPHVSSFIRINQPTTFA